MSLCVKNSFSYNHMTADDGSCIEVNILIPGQGSQYRRSINYSADHNKMTAYLCENIHVRISHFWFNFSGEG